MLQRDMETATARDADKPGPAGREKAEAEYQGAGAMAYDASRVIIIEGARAGVRDPHDLCKMAVKDLHVVPSILECGTRSARGVQFIVRRN